MSEMHTCPECSAPLAADAPLGLCPKCLLGAAYSQSSVGGKPLPPGKRSTSRAGRSSAPVEPRAARAAKPPPPTLVDVDEFRRGAVELGLLSDQQFAWYQSAVQGSVSDLARVLVRAGKLTPYQAGALSQGKAKGLVVGDFLILDKLGTGGMGVVFKARHRHSAQIVALKLLPPSFGRDRDAVLRFHREFQVAARLKHPNVVSALEAIEDRGVHCLTMEYIEGHDLDRLVTAGGPLAVKQALDCVIQAARGLEAAHAAGIIHRDIKPANLMLDSSGTVKLLDLGLARLVGSAGPFGPSAQNNLTQSRMYLGTVDYMAPEQADDPRKVDHRADIYSLGCTFFFLLTGRPPFDGDTTLKLIMAHYERPAPSLLAVGPTTPHAIDAVYEKMMAKRPSDRPQSATELIGLLESCRTSADEEDEARWGLRTFADTVMKRAATRRPDREPSILAPRRESGPLEFDPDLRLEDVITGYHAEAHAEPLTEGQLPPRTWTPDPLLTRRRARRVREAWLLAGAAVGVMAMMAVGFVTAVNLWRGAKGRPPVNRADAKPKDGRKQGPPAPNQVPASAATTPSAPLKVVLGPNDPEPSDQLRRENIASYELFAAGHGDAAKAPAQLAEVIGDSRLQQWSGIASIALSHDGKTLVSGGVGDETAVLWNLDTGRMDRQIVVGPHHYSGEVVAMSPDGRLLADFCDDGPKLWEISSGRQRAELPRARELSRWADWGRLAFSRDGGFVAACGCKREGRKRTARLMVWDARTGQHVLTRDETESNSDYIDLCFDPEGKTVYALARVGPDNDPFKNRALLRCWDTKSGREFPLNLNIALSISGYWSLYGSPIAARFFQESQSLLYRAQKPHGGRPKNSLPAAFQEQWVVFDLATRTDRRFQPFPDSVPGDIWALSPDGRTVCLYDRIRSERLAFVNVATGAKHQPKEKMHWGNVKSGNYSSDGSKVAILTGLGSRIWDVKTETELLPRGRLQGGPRSVTFCPDGRCLAIEVADGVMLWDLAARAEVAFQTTSFPRAVSPDGRFLASPQGAGSVRVLEIPSGRERSVIAKPALPPDEHHETGVHPTCFAFSADGQTMAFGYGNAVVEVRDASTGHTIKTLRGAAEYVDSVTFSPDGRWIAAASVDHEHSRAISESLRAEIAAVLDAKRATTKRGQKIRIKDRSYGGLVVLWDALGNAVMQMPGASAPLAFSADSSMFAADWSLGESDGTVVPIIDTSTGKLRQVLVGHDSNQGRSPTFAPDGETVATWGYDGSVRLWELATGRQQQVIRLCPEGGHIAQVAFSPTGRYLATANGNGTVYILRLKSR
jgi:serine/threonine protein kinase/WD40 repeat protein